MINYRLSYWKFKLFEGWPDSQEKIGTHCQDSIGANTLLPLGGDLLSSLSGIPAGEQLQKKYWLLQ